MSSWWKLIFTKFKLSPIFLVSPVLPPLIWLSHVPTWSLNRKMNLYRTWDYRILSHAQSLIYCGTMRGFSYFSLFWFVWFSWERGLSWIPGSSWLVWNGYLKEPPWFWPSATQKWSHMDPLAFFFPFFLTFCGLVGFDLLCCFNNCKTE